MGEDFVAELEEHSIRGGGGGGARGGVYKERCKLNLKSCKTPLAALIDRMGGEDDAACAKVCLFDGDVGRACERQG